MTGRSRPFTNDWIVMAVRYLFDDMFVANDATSIALQLTFTLETGFTNLRSSAWPPTRSTWATWSSAR